MQATASHLEYPSSSGQSISWTAFVLALLAHGVLLAVLAVGVSWKRDAEPVSVQAELWSALPQTSAPPDTTPEPPPEPEPKPTPKPQPVVAPEPPPPVKAPAIVREKKPVEKPKVEPPKETPAKDKVVKEKPVDKAAKDKQDAKLAEQQRQENMRRLSALAGTTGATGPSGSDAQTSGPSASYLGKVAGAIKSNITFTDSQRSSIAGNPGVEIDIRALPDGTLIDPVLVKSSGNKAWDDAVLAAIAKTTRIPRDENGRAPGKIPFTFRPKD